MSDEFTGNMVCAECGADVEHIVAKYRIYGIQRVNMIQWNGHVTESASETDEQTDREFEQYECEYCGSTGEYIEDMVKPEDESEDD